MSAASFGFSGALNLSPITVGQGSLRKGEVSALCLPWTASAWQWLCSSISASSSWHQLSKSLFFPVKGIFMYCRSFWEFWVVPSSWSRGMKRRLLLDPAGIPFRTFQVHEFIMVGLFSLHNSLWHVLWECLNVSIKFGPTSPLLLRKELSWGIQNVLLV